MLSDSAMSDTDLLKQRWSFIMTEAEVNEVLMYKKQFLILINHNNNNNNEDYLHQ